MRAKGTGCALIAAALLMVSCGGGTLHELDPTLATGLAPDQLKSVLMWKGNASGNGLYSSELVLTPENVNRTHFGKIAQFTFSGVPIAQPLYVANVSMGAQGVHNIIIIASEHDEVLAFDADSPSNAPLWDRSYLGPGITTGPDNYGGRTTLGGEVGISGTPVIDPATGAMYFVTTIDRSGVLEQWLRAIDIRTGQDYGPGSVKIAASVPGDGPGCMNGQCAFDPTIQLQRAGLTLVNGNVVIGWGSFSDWGVYRGWLMAYNSQTLQQTAAYSPATQHQDQDDANGPADHGGGAGIWGGGAAPAIDASGNIYVVTADGSFNADSGGNNYGDSALRLQIANGAFQVAGYFSPQVADYFSPADRPCLDAADLEIGSGGLMLLPADAAGGASRAVVAGKEGRLYLLDPTNLGGTTSDDHQIPQQFMVGNRTCMPGMGGGDAEGRDWQRLYGNASYWNGSIYLAPANTTLRQYRFSNSSLTTSPASQSPTMFGLRGGNTVVSSNGNTNGIVWAYTKNYSGIAELHAYDANDVSHELWSSTMNSQRDGMGEGVGFAVPVVVNGTAIAASVGQVAVYGRLR